MSFTLAKYHEPDFLDSRFLDAPDAKLVPVIIDKVAPDNYHGTTIFPEYFKIGGQWHLAEDSRMDCLAVWDGTHIKTIEFRHLKKGDLVVVGRTEDASEGIYIHAHGFKGEGENSDLFSFRKGRSRETSFSKDYDTIYELLKYEKKHGFILWVMGPACSFDANSRSAFAALINAGYVHGLLSGNALATHDLEAAYLHTALGQDVYTQKSHPLGHYNHLDTLNKVRQCGSIEAFIEQGYAPDGIIRALVQKKVPYVLAGSIRDDGPLPEVYACAYDSQDAMRALVRQATTVICLATTLHTIATGNLTPSYRVVKGKVRPLFFYSVDVSEFSINKLQDRGSLAVKTIVTNVQDFITNVCRGVTDKPVIEPKE